MKQRFKSISALFLTMIIFIIGMSVTTIIANAEIYYTIRIEYRFSDETNAHDPYVAVFPENTEVNITINNPIIPGYKPVTSLEEDREDALSTVLDFTLTEDKTITVYYVPDLVPYKVRYFKQNIRDDLYTEDLSLSNEYYERYGYTGEYPEYLENLEFEGFTSLFHEPDFIAADGSTVFKVYYDRNYYLISFDLNGGYGVEPVYGKYQAHYSISTPKRLGYVFKGWALTDSSGNYIDSEGNNISEEQAIVSADPFTGGTIPAENLHYKAMWAAQETKYSVLYWIEDADDENYSVIAAKDIENVLSGTVVKLDDVTSFFDYTDMASAFPDMSSGEITEFQGKSKYFERNDELSDEQITLEGDGTSRINVYYDRVIFTQQFFYAKKYGGAYYVPTSTNNFGTGNGDKRSILSNLEISGIAWSPVNGTPEFRDKYSDLETKTLLSNDGQTEYYYYEKNTKYYANMKNDWLTDAFTDLPKYQKEEQWTRFGAWTAERGTQFATQSNKTIKGIYERLDDQMMFNDGRENYTELHYLAFWTNGAGSTPSWNNDKKVILSFTYQNYDQILPEEESLTDEQLLQNGTYIDIITNSGNGLRYELTSDHVIETLDAGTQYNNKTGSAREDAVIKNQTPTALTGFTLAKGGNFSGKNPISDDSCWVEYDYDKDGTIDFDSNHHAYVKFFYNRNIYSLKFRNGNIKDDTKTRSLAYKQSLSGNDANGNSIYYTPEYFNSDLSDYYTFEGWYKDPFYIEKVEMNEDGTDFSDSELMPADDETLYAKWTPVQEKVEFCNDYNKYTQNTVLHSCLVNYNEYINTSDVPVVSEGLYILTPPTSNSKFAGWYYFNEAGAQVRFDPESLPVTKSLKLYAEWVSSDTAKYKVTYREYGSDTEVASPSTGTAFVSKTKSFSAKSGNELNETHAWVDGQKNWWPIYSSHSILMEPNSTGEEYEPNTYSFEYIQKEKVWYQVRYVNTATGKDMEGVETKISTSNTASITESSVYIQGYIADRVTKSIILAASVSSDEETVKAEELSMNTIIFYYTENTTEALYQLDHMIQDLGTDPEDTSNYSLYMSETLTAVLGDVLDLEQICSSSDISQGLQSSGYSLDLSMTTVEGALEGDNPQADGNKLIITLYYKRLTYPYTVRYIDYEQEKKYENATEEERESLWDGVFYTKTYSDDDARYVGEVIEINPPSTYAYTPEGETETINYSRISDTQLSLTIRPDAETPQTNILDVYYKKDSQRMISYRAVCLDETDDSFASLSSNREIVENQQQIQGCTVYPNTELSTRYTFLGWYDKPDASDTVLTTGTTYVPQFPGADMTYYAVFSADKVKADVKVMYNSSGDYNDTENAAVEDTDGSMTGYEIVFTSPENYTSGGDVFYDSAESFVFSAKPKDDKMYRYEFSGWYVIDSKGIGTLVEDAAADKEFTLQRTENCTYAAMFKKVTSVPYRLIYTFNTRNFGEQSYVVNGTLDENEFKGDVGYIEPTAENVMANAPYESNYGETLVWNDSDILISYSDGTVIAELTARQSVSTVTVSYRLAPTDSYITISVNTGANRETDKQLEALYAYDKYEDKYFSYWEIRKSSDEKSDVIARCYDQWFTFCIMDDYWVTPVYDTEDPAAEPETGENLITLKHLDYYRNRWTDEKGDITSDGGTDILYSDYEVNFGDSLIQIVGSDEYRTGLVYERCATVPSNVEFDPSKDYKAASDETNLKEAIKNKASSYCYKGTKKRNILVDDIETSELTNKNRIHSYIYLKNNYTQTDETETYINANYLFKVTAYVIHNDEVTLSNSVYMCLRDISEKDLAAGELNAVTDMEPAG